MKRTRNSFVVVALVLGTGVSVRADLRGASGDPTVLTAGRSASLLVSITPPATIVTPVAFTDAQAYEAMLVGQDPEGVVGAESLALEPDPLTSRQNVIKLPPAPSSTALFFSAMVSIGAWQLVRSSKDFHLGAMPQWYHTGGPVQVGHTTAFDFNFISLPVCLFDEPVAEQVFLYRTRRDVHRRLESQSFLSIADPRGPPTLTV